MFKNRVRTAALAGAVALATGLSGFSVPAFAQDTQQGGYQQEDGSAAADLVAKNVTEDQLKALTDETADYLNKIQNRPSFRTLVNHYVNLGEPGFDPSEEAAAAAFAEARAEAEAELAKAAANIQEARASVKYALEKDQIATEDWKAYVAALNAFRADINPLVETANAKKSHEDFPVLPTISAADMHNARAVHGEINALLALIEDTYNKAADWSVDDAKKKYISREYMAALKALREAALAGAPAVEAAWETAKDSNVEAQLSDVLVRQLFLERATAQRDTLRVFKAWISVFQRYNELYQDNVLVGDSTLRTEYREILDDIHRGLLFNVGQLNKADAATVKYFLHWKSDRQNNNDGDYRIFKEHADFALKTYHNSLLNGAIWQEKLDRVELIDLGLKADREAAAKAAADRERELKAAEELAAAQKAIADALAKDKVDGGQSTTKPGSSSFKLSS